eukprot:2916694-Pyramimonas_sp.AAC.1
MSSCGAAEAWTASAVPAADAATLAPSEGAPAPAPAAAAASPGEPPTTSPSVVFRFFATTRSR